MPLPDANNYSMRIYELLKETDLENLSYLQFKGVAEKLFIEPENEDEMRRLVLVQLARMAVRGDWNGFLSGSTGTIGGSTTEDLIAFGAASADTITKDAGIAVVTKGGGGTSVIKVGSINIGAQYVSANTANGSVTLRSDGTGQIFLNSGSDYGGTYTDTTVNVMKNGLANVNQIKFRDTVNENNATLTETSGELNVKSNVDAKDITLETKTTGLVRVKNQTTNTDTQLNVQGNGTGTPKINLSNDSKAVTIQCDETQKLKVIGGSDDFIFDVSSATGGITFPDGTVQNTAASGGGGGSGLGVVMSPANASLAAADTYLIGRQSPYAIWADYDSSNNQNTSNNPRYWPFIAPTAGSISEMSIRVGTAQSGTNLLVGIYEDSSGVPGTQVATASFDVSSTGYVTVTSFSGTNSLDANSQYWFGHVADTSRTTLQLYQLLDSQILPTLPAAGLSSKPGYCFYSSDSNSLPAAPTLAGATDSGRLFASIQIT
jgi:hypothetical protein